MKNIFYSIPLIALIANAGVAAPLEAFQDCDVCPVMIELPMGDFIMGAPEDEFRRNLVWRDGALFRATPEHPHVNTDEGPQHRVVVDIPFAMGRDEVTFEQWMACVNGGGCSGYVPREEILKHGLVRGRSWVGGSHPVLYVSYEDALLYVAWLNRTVGTDAYRLPTEAEWEYAARAGTTTRFAQGDSLTDEQANFSGLMTERFLADEGRSHITRGGPVRAEDLDAANAWGLRHMSGNVNEVTQSCYTERYLGWATTSEWLEKSGAENCRRSNRSGSYKSPIDNSRVAFRNPTDQDDRSFFEGFRILKELK